MFKIETVPKCPKRIQQAFQADEDLGLDAIGRLEVKTKDKTFSISSFAFTPTDHLVDQLIGKPKNQLIEHSKLGCVLAEFGSKDHRDDASHSILMLFMVFRLTKSTAKF